MNTTVVKTAPPRHFEEVAIQMPDWENYFLKLVQAGWRIKYDVFTMPEIPVRVLGELDKRGYRHLILEGTEWHFLVPKGEICHLDAVGT